MNNKHTPGKWIKANSGGVVLVFNGTRYKRIALLEDTPLKITPEIEANANLIAAAPELLQMVYDLKQCIKRLTQDGLSQFDRDTEAQWIGEAHELLNNVNPDYYSNANKNTVHH